MDNTFGIVVYESDSILIENNTIYSDSRPVASGIEVRVSEDITILDNVIQKCAFGIYIMWSDLCTLSNNGIDICNDGIILRDTTKINVIDNTIEESSRNGIVIKPNNLNLVATVNDTIVILREPISYENNISHNIVTDSGESGIFLFNSHQNIIFGNTVSRNSGHGIHLEEYFIENDIFENTVANNSKSGIYLYQKPEEDPKSQGNMINNNVVENNGEYGIYIEGPINTLLYDNEEEGNTLKQEEKEDSSPNLIIVILTFLVLLIFVLIILYYFKMKE
jgi:parallel beta-helix repeat protein